MIGSLRGTLGWRDGDEVCVEVAGVGYRVVVLPTTSVSLGEVGSDVYLHTHHHVREDAQVLYGFATLSERSTFEVLIGTHGVGPSLALAILGVHPPASLARVLADEDLAALCLVPGVGRKTGARLLVELRNRLVPEDGTVPVVPGVPTGDGTGGGVRSDVAEALTQLGYAPDEVAGIIGGLPEGDDPAELLREALRRLAVGEGSGQRRA